MSWYLIVLVFIEILGASTLAYQIYKMTELDAASRGLKHPKFWGFFFIEWKWKRWIITIFDRKKKISIFHE